MIRDEKLHRVRNYGERKNTEDYNIVENLKYIVLELFTSGNNRP